MLTTLSGVCFSKNIVELPVLKSRFIAEIRLPMDEEFKQSGLRDFSCQEFFMDMEGFKLFSPKSSNKEKKLMNIICDDAYSGPQAAWDNHKEWAISEYQAKSIVATSELFENNKHYGVENLSDGNYYTAWSEGVEGNGIGQTIKYNIDSRWRDNKSDFFIDYIGGYAKSKKLYLANARVKQFRLYINAVPVAYIEIEDQWGIHSITISDLESFKIIQGTTYIQTISLQITQVYPGLKYQDLLITEMTISSWVN